MDTPERQPHPDTELVESFKTALGRYKFDVKAHSQNAVDLLCGYERYVSAMLGVEFGEREAQSVYKILSQKKAADEDLTEREIRESFYALPLIDSDILIAICQDDTSKRFILRETALTAIETGRNFVDRLHERCQLTRSPELDISHDVTCACEGLKRRCSTKNTASILAEKCVNADFDSPAYLFDHAAEKRTALLRLSVAKDLKIIGESYANAIHDDYSHAYFEYFAPPIDTTLHSRDNPL